MTPKQWRAVAEQAYHARDSDAHTLALDRLLAPDLMNFTPPQLLAHRDELLRQLGDVNDRLAHQNGPGRLTQALAHLLHEFRPDASLDPSDP